MAGLLSYLFLTPNRFEALRRTALTKLINEVNYKSGSDRKLRSICRFPRAVL
ncbi:hypothetical protein FHK02_5731 [Spirosoma sp. LMG 31448]|nr:hypothetical protein [Spirosoma utsteinense]